MKTFTRNVLPQHHGSDHWRAGCLEIGPVRFGKGPSEKDTSHGHLVGGLLHSASGPQKRTGGDTGTALRADSTTPVPSYDSPTPTACGSPASPRTRPASRSPSWNCGTASGPAPRTASGRPRHRSAQPSPARHHPEPGRAGGRPARPGPAGLDVDACPERRNPQVGTQTSAAATVLRRRPARHLRPPPAPPRPSPTLDPGHHHRVQPPPSTAKPGLKGNSPPPRRAARPRNRGTRRPPDTTAGPQPHPPPSCSTETACRENRQTVTKLRG